MYASALSNGRLSGATSPPSDVRRRGWRAAKLNKGTRLLRPRIPLRCASHCTWRSLLLELTSTNPASVGGDAFVPSSKRSQRYGTAGSCSRNQSGLFSSSTPLLHLYISISPLCTL